MSQYRDLNDFLRKHKTIEKDGITHTRIGDGNNILPGKYIINETELGIFYKLYHKHVFIDKKKEYLTEKQITNGKSQILVDLDFRYDKSVETRKHCSDHIEDIIHIYSEKISTLSNVYMPSFIFLTLPSLISIYFSTKLLITISKKKVKYYFALLLIFIGVISIFNF